jgi:hypothetical protein
MTTYNAELSRSLTTKLSKIGCGTVLPPHCYSLVALGFPVHPSTISVEGRPFAGCDGQKDIGTFLCPQDVTCLFFESNFSPAIHGIFAIRTAAYGVRSGGVT